MSSGISKKTNEQETIDDLDLDLDIEGIDIGDGTGDDDMKLDDDELNDLLK